MPPKINKDNALVLKKIQGKVKKKVKVKKPQLKEPSLVKVKISGETWESANSFKQGNSVVQYMTEEIAGSQLGNNTSSIDFSKNIVTKNKKVSKAAEKKNLHKCSDFNENSSKKKPKESPLAKNTSPDTSSTKTKKVSKATKNKNLNKNPDINERSLGQKPKESPLANITSPDTSSLKTKKVSKATKNKNLNKNPHINEKSSGDKPKECSLANIISPADTSLTKTRRVSKATKKKKLDTSSHINEGSSEEKQMVTRRRKADSTIKPQVLKTNTKRKKAKDLPTKVGKGSKHLNCEVKNDTNFNEILNGNLSSSSDCLSWTREISSSSTTTCVTVETRDLVRIDDKLPMSKLMDIENKEQFNLQNACKSSSLTSDLSSDDFTLDSSDNEAFIEESDTESFNISRQSSSSNKTSNKSDTTMNDQLDDALEKLCMHLKNVDMEMIDWVGYENEEINNNDQNYCENLLKLFKLENHVMQLCQTYKKSFSVNLKTPVYKSENEKFSSQVSQDESNFHKHVINDISLPSAAKEYKDNTMNLKCDKLISEHKNMCNGLDDYDDDALSIFAESIESSRMSIVDPVTEDYIPQPVSVRKLSESSYPSKITESTDIDYVGKTKSNSECEKHNADSTSTNRKSEQRFSRTYEDSQIQTSHVNVNNKDTFTHLSCESTVPVTEETEISNKTIYLSDCYITPQAVKSVLFKGVCFFNLISTCKKFNCNFPHYTIRDVELKNRIESLNTKQFIEEYMLIRNWPKLRRLYSLCFVESCVRRKLDEVLIEMGIDSIIKANVNSKTDTELKIEILETVLLYLNNVNMNKLCNYLKFVINENKLLCDVLMMRLAETQNFTRFKKVFINLTDFIITNGRSFSLIVAVNIVERVCILPSERILYEVTLKIIRNTSFEIFLNPCITNFEKQLSLFDDLLNDFKKLKHEHEKSIVTNKVDSYNSVSLHGLNSIPVNRDKSFASQQIYPNSNQFQNKLVNNKFDKSNNSFASNSLYEDYLPPVERDDSLNTTYLRKQCVSHSYNSPVSSNVNNDQVKRYGAPDTTRVETLLNNIHADNKHEPVFIRTFNNTSASRNRTHHFNKRRFNCKHNKNINVLNPLMPPRFRRKFQPSQSAQGMFFNQHYDTSGEPPVKFTRRSIQEVRRSH